MTVRRPEEGGRAAPGESSTLANADFGSFKDRKVSYGRGWEGGDHDRAMGSNSSPDWSQLQRRHLFRSSQETVNGWKGDEEELE